MWKLYISIVLLFSLQVKAILPPPVLPFEIVKQWNLLNYNFPWDLPSHDPKFYNPQNIVATGFEMDSYRIFIATPRLLSGVPATLNTIVRGGIADSNILQAYPDWSQHTISSNKYNCSDIGLVSVYRVRIDSCNRLWALDAGVSRSLEDYEITCPPKILVYDLNTDQVVRRIDFPPEVLRNQSLFTNLIIDETTSIPGNNCDDVFVYITDTVAPGIVVYDSERDFTWRLTHPSMFPDPNFAVSTIDGYQFELMDGIVGLTFDKKHRKIYFQPLATDRLFSISADELRAGPVLRDEDLPVQLVGRKSSQGIGLAVSPYSSIIFSPFTETAVGEWDPRTNTQTVLAHDPEKIQFAADIRVHDSDPGYVYVLTSKFHRYFLKNVDFNEVNVRILRIKLKGFGSVKPIYGQPSTAYGNPLYNTYPTKQSTYYTTTFKYDPLNTPSSFVQNHVNNLKNKEPFNYKTFGVVNKNYNNQLSSTNSGENPTYYSAYHSFTDGTNSNILRFAKSITYNVTSTH